MTHGSTNILFYPKTIVCKNNVMLLYLATYEQQNPYDMLVTLYINYLLRWLSHHVLEEGHKYTYICTKKFGLSWKIIGWHLLLVSMSQNLQRTTLIQIWLYKGLHGFAMINCYIILSIRNLMPIFHRVHLYVSISIFQSTDDIT